MLRLPVRCLRCGAASGNSLDAQYHKRQPAWRGHSSEECRVELATLFSHLRGRINEQYTARAASVAAGENIELYSALFEQLAKEQDKRCFTGTAHGQITDACDGSSQFLRAYESAVIKCISYAYAQTEKRNH